MSIVMLAKLAEIERVALAEQLNEMWCDNEEVMGEMAAYSVACSQLGIDEDEGWDLLALIGEEVNSE
jgi:hypothetical protein